MKTHLPLRFARAAMAITIAAALPLTSASAAGPEIRPVMTGLDGPEVDACGSQGAVRGLRDEDGTLFLSVRSAPSNTAQETGQLKNGDAIILCDSTRDGKWVGIVYPTAGQTIASCATSSPAPRRAAYSGPCRSGWAASTFVTVTAG